MFKKIGLMGLVVVVLLVLMINGYVSLEDYKNQAYGFVNETVESHVYLLFLKHANVILEQGQVDLSHVKKEDDRLKDWLKTLGLTLKNNVDIKPSSESFMARDRGLQFWDKVMHTFETQNTMTLDQLTSHTNEIETYAKEARQNDVLEALKTTKRLLREAVPPSR